MTATFPLPGSLASLVAPGVIAWPPYPDGLVDDTVIRPGGLVLTVEHGVAHCITDAPGDMRCRPLGLRHTRLPLADVGVVDQTHGEPTRYLRRAWRTLAGELVSRHPNQRVIDTHRDLIATLRRLP